MGAGVVNMSIGNCDQGLLDAPLVSITDNFGGLRSPPRTPPFNAPVLESEWIV
jgi:hypothetical protein